MKVGETSVRVLSGGEASFHHEADSIQAAAERRIARVVKLGPLVFFSAESGDAWMLDPADHTAACLARDGEALGIPIEETDTKLRVEWDSDYSIEGEAFTVVERATGGSRTIIGYPTAHIERLAREFPAEAFKDSSASEKARARLKTGRNEPCPCGSGKKYKKCCLHADEDALRRFGAFRHTAETKRAETRLTVPKNADADSDDPDVGDLYDDEWDDATDVDLPEDVLEKADDLWDTFGSRKNPSREDMDALVVGLLDLPPEAAEWESVMHRLADRGHPDLPGVFRRIASAVPHTKATNMGFFYWAAVEEFAERGMKEVQTEVVDGFCRLDAESYDPDALKHVEDWLLVAGCDAETLRLCEHFLPILRAGEGLMPYVVPETCVRIFNLRVGRAIQVVSGGTEAPGLIAGMPGGIDDEIDADVARTTAEIIRGEAPLQVWARSDFNLVAGDPSSDDDARRNFLRFAGMLVRVGQEAWQVEGRSPGGALCGLTLLLGSLDHWRRPKSKRRVENLLECLNIVKLEERVSRACPEIMGVNRAKVRLLLGTLGILNRSAARHGLIPAVEAAAVEEEVSRLERVVKSIGK